MLLQRALVPAVFARARLGADGLPLDEDKDVVVGRVIPAVIFTVTLLIAIMVGAGSLVQSVAEEKENRSIEVLLTSVQPLSLMAAKVLALGAAGLAMVVIWVGSVVVVVPLLFESFPDAPVFQVDLMLLVWVTSFFLAGYLLSAIVLAGLGAISAGTKEANQLSMLVILPLLVPLQLMMLIIPNPDGGPAQVLSYIPFTAPVTMMLRLAFGEPELLEVLASLGLVVLSAAAMLWVSARIFRAGLLMYGQRMSLGRAVSALRQAG
jgi:ABC-2 type transport system permease protein